MVERAGTMLLSIEDHTISRGEMQVAPGEESHMSMSMLMRCAAAAATGAVPLSACAQFGPVGWNVNVIGGTVSPINPIVTVRIAARFQPVDHAFAAAAFSVVATEPGWGTPTPLLPPPGNAGLVQGTHVTGILLGQIHFPPSVHANTMNPIDIWQATWSTHDFRARTVGITTETIRFDVYTSATSPASESRLAWLIEGSAVIHVIPAPASVLALLGVAAMAGRRGRGGNLPSRG